MDKRTKIALFESTAHWGRLSTGEHAVGETIGSGCCALCQKFNTNQGCDGCPVAGKSGMYYCHGTPYYDVQRYLSLLKTRGFPRTAEAQHVAEPMFQYLFEIVQENGLLAEYAEFKKGER